MYLQLLKKVLLDYPYREKNVTETNILEGNYLPKRAHTLLGMKRLDNIQECMEHIKKDNISGDIIECGLYKGGSLIFMVGVNKYLKMDKKIYGADSFQGCPPPEPEKYPADTGDPHSTFSHLCITLDDVKRNLQSYDLLNDRVQFISGFYEQSLQNTEIKQLSLLRLDCDMYSSTMQALEALYDKVIYGGYVIIDDYGAIANCKQAVDDFR